MKTGASTYEELEAMASKGEGMYFNGTPIWELEATEPPPIVTAVWYALRQAWGRDAKFIYILSSVAKQHCSTLKSVGLMGWADIDNKIVYVVESDLGEIKTIATLLAVFRYLMQGCCFKESGCSMPLPPPINKEEL